MTVGLQGFYPRFKAFIPNTNLPNSNGYVYTYAAGTTTPLATKSSPGGADNTNPVRLDSQGEASIYFGTSAYKIDIRDANNVSLAGFPIDNYSAPATQADIAGIPAVVVDLSSGVSLSHFGDISSSLDAALAAAKAYKIKNIKIPQGDYTLNSTLVIDQDISISGTGSCAAGTIAARASGGGTGQPGEATTRITYHGTGPAIQIVGTGTEGLENVHLSDFSLWGNSTPDGGIKIGTGVVVSKSTFKNIHVYGFQNTGTDKGYGIYIGNCIESLFENVYCQSNRDGFNIYGIATTLDFRSVYSRTNTRYGAIIQQLNGCSLDKFILEGNAGSGLVINARNGQSISALSFYHLYTEANCDSISGPVITIDKTGTGSCIDVIFYRPTIYETVAGNVTRLIKFDHCDSVKFLEASLTSWASGFAECTASTAACVISGRAGGYYPHSNVVGNGYDSDGNRMVLLTAGDPRTGLWTPTISSGGTASSMGTCRYIRDGNFITVFGVANITAISGVVVLGSLPFTPQERVVNGSSSKVSTAVCQSVMADTDGNLYITYSTTYSGGAITTNFSCSYYI